VKAEAVSAVRHLLIISIIVAAAGLSGCGRRGPLEPPPGSESARIAAEAAKQRQQEQADSATPSVAPGATRRRPPPIQPPRDGFVLDKLLD
jgi:predicted small lipoprotein YifL